MKTDIKILKIGLLATAAILAPVATMMIQYELREDEENEFEGEFELIATETVVQPILKGPEEKPSIATEAEKKIPRRGRRFKTMQDCLKFYKKCTKISENKLKPKKQISFNWTKELAVKKDKILSLVLSIR